MPKINKSSPSPTMREFPPNMDADNAHRTHGVRKPFSAEKKSQTRFFRPRPGSLNEIRCFGFGRPIHVPNARPPKHRPKGKWPRGFSYPIAVLTMLVLAILTGMLLVTYRNSEEIDQSWANLDQAVLHLSNGIHYFYQIHPEWAPLQKPVHLEFAPQNGFQTDVLPLAGYWLTQTVGYCDRHNIRQRQIIGLAHQPEHVLSLNQSPDEVIIEPNVSINGSLLLAAGNGANSSGSGLFAYETGQIYKANHNGLRAYFNAHFDPDYIKQLNPFFPKLTVLQDASPQLDSLPAAGSDFILILGDSITLQGHAQGQIPILIVAQEAVLAREAVTLNLVWMVARTRISFIQGLAGKHVHLMSPSIQIQGVLSLDQSSLLAVNPTPANPSASISLKGTGTFSGSLTALSADDLHPSTASIIHRIGVLKDRRIRSSGSIYSDGYVSIRGFHRGPVRAEIWRFTDGDATYNGKIADLTLEKSAASVLSPWGHPQAWPESLYQWDFETVDPDTAERKDDAKE